MEAKEQVRIFDTTLRDGEQSPGFTMTGAEKLTVGRQLERLGVDVIEAGFAAASEGDAAAVAGIAQAVTRPVVLSLSRTRRGDIERALSSVEKAAHPGIHIFIATSEVHLQHKLMMSRQEVLDAACWAVSFAKQHVDHIEFSAEDASRSDPDYLTQIFGEVIKVGACVLNVPDTTGYAVPREFGELIRHLVEYTSGGDRVTWSAHCHNDLGLAVANSLAAVQNGVRQVECTVNGIGERAGNTSMEEVVMAIKTRCDVYQGFDVGVTTEQIYPTSRLLSRITGVPIPLNKPIVGDNAFAHEAGIHQDGVLKDKLTYEIMRPESIGLPSNRLVLGKHSGRHAFVRRLEELGIDRSGVDMNRAFERFKALADKKKHIYDADLVALVVEESARAPDRYELLYLNVTSSSMAVPHATVKMRINGEERLGHGTGDGMVDACYKVIAQIVGVQPVLERYAVSAITGGTEAQGEVSCLLRDEQGRTAAGHGVHTDIIMASAAAYVNGLNRLDSTARCGQTDHSGGP